MIKNGFNHLIALGTHPHKDPKYNKIVRLINLLSFIVILTIASHMLISLYFHSFIVALIQLLTIIVIGLTIFFNSRGFLNIARALALLTGNFHIFSLVVILGIDSGVHFYFYPGIIGPLILYSSKELKYILFFASLTITLALLAQYLGNNFQPIAETQNKLLIIFSYFAVFGSHVVVLFFYLNFYIESNRFEKSLEKVNIKLLELSETDPLTQLPNRRSFIKDLDREWGKGVRNKNPISVIMIDVDYFKMFNDYYGHLEGDQCLVRIGEIISKNTREFIDFPARYGGEEFIILLSDTQLDRALITAKRIRNKLLNSAIPHLLNKPDRIVTCSFGVACYIPNNDSNPKEIIQKADVALYKAKKRGRNRIEQDS